MLSPPDADLARRDSAIPGLGLLLDPEAFAKALRTALPDAGVGAAKARYVRYKPGTNCLVAYRLEVAGAETDVYAKAFRADARGKLRNAYNRLKAGSRLGPGGAVLDDAVTAVFAFPNDLKLDSLADVAGGTSRQRGLAGLVPDHPDLWGASLLRLRYKPERRYVARMVSKTGAQALLKVYAAHEYSAAIHGVSAFVSRGPLQVARRIGQADRRRALVLEWLPGQSLSEALHDPRFDANTLHLVGEALAELHAQKAPGLARTDGASHVASLLAAAGAVAAICPHLAERAHDLTYRIAGKLPRISLQANPIHGDFSADQVLLNGAGVSILDLDAATHSDAAADLGSFAADLEYRALGDHLSAHRAATTSGALVEGYCAARRCREPDDLDLYVAAGLLRLAPHPFRNREPDWPARTGAILERCGAILDRYFRSAPLPLGLDCQTCGEGNRIIQAKRSGTIPGQEEEGMAWLAE
jgi:tRNA A-37 threonylcarbamoyl transferase component Bud32